MSPELATIAKDVNGSLPERKIIALIDRTNLSADMKALLHDLTKITVKVGSTILAIGRKILTFVFDLLKAFPAMAFGVLVALVLTALVGSIPIIGAALASVFSGILLLLGMGAGAVKDLSNPSINEKIDTLVGSFSALLEV